MENVQMRKWLVVLVLTLAIGSACGKKPYSGSLGKCSYTSNGNEICVEYSYSGELILDPKTKALTESKTACTASSGTFVENGTCTKTGLAGTCKTTATATENGESFSFTQLLHYPSAVTNAQTTCATLAGSTWTAGTSVALNDSKEAE